MKIYSYDLAYYDFLTKYNCISDNLLNSKFIILDIETTGFSRQFCKVMLVGFVVFSGKDENIKVIQYFDDDGFSEKELLSKSLEVMSKLDYDYLFTYNGQAFDLPFLNSRLEFLHMNIRFPFSNHIDIYQIVRKYHKKFNLDNYKLKTLEIYLGISREDTISGKESVDLYNSFLETKDLLTQETILLHNYDDIVNMLPLLEIFNKNIISIDEYVTKTIYDNKSNNRIKYNSNIYLLNSIVKSTNKSWTFIFQSTVNISDDLIKNLYYSRASIIINKNYIEISIEIDFEILDGNKIGFINLKDYSLSNSDDYLVIFVDDYAATDHLINNFFNLII